jgi:hypothetical protein
MTMFYKNRIWSFDTTWCDSSWTFEQKSMFEFLCIRLNEAGFTTEDAIHWSRAYLIKEQYPGLRYSSATEERLGLLSKILQPVSV